MLEDLELILEDTEDSMKKAISHLEIELTKIRAGKATPSMLDGINVEYYGAPSPISQIANISIFLTRVTLRYLTIRLSDLIYYGIRVRRA